MNTTSNESERADSRSSINRRTFLASSTGALALSLSGNLGRLNAETAQQSGTLAPPRFTLSPNLELLFPQTMDYEERLRRVGEAGAKAYSFWGFDSKNLDNLIRVADRFGMRCASLAGSGMVGGTTGLTAPGEEKKFFDYFRRAVAAAKKVGAQNAVTFVGQRIDSIPWSVQYGQIIEGLKVAGDIAAEADVYLTLEPLNRLESPKMSVLTAQEGFQIVREVDHPYVKLDFDIYHLQLSEGNLSNNLREGLKEGLIQYVEVGDVPGRFEPGTGEINYRYVFNLLREVEYNGFVGMEHRAKASFEQAFENVRKMAGFE